MRVEVLLATRNGEQFLEPMLESLATQTYSDFVLVVSDDCSSDKTLSILKNWTSRFANTLEIEPRNIPSGSAAANFSSLLTLSRGDYVFFADQDDIWLPDKLEAGLKRIRELERNLGTNTPLITHSDAIIIDGNGNRLAPSFWAYKSITPEFGTSLNTALMHPSVTGCTAGINRSLVDRVRQIPKAAVMHDWWVNLVAAAFGRVDFTATQHILYRIHSSNTSSPKRSSFLGMLARSPKPAEIRQWLKLRLDQGANLLETYNEELPLSSRDTLEQFASISTASFVEKRKILLSRGFLSPDPLRNVAALLFI
jgi:glycosyltransferase involved in cell wall biosynthesis